MTGYLSSINERWKNNGVTGVIEGIHDFLYYQFYRKAKFELSDNIKSHTVNDVTVQVPMEEYWEYKHFSEMIDEEIMIADMISEIKSDDVVYDIGAFLGWHTLFASSAGPDGATIAFEPHPVSHARLRQALRHAKGPVQTYNYALSDVESTVTVPENISSGATISELTGENGAYETKAVPGDEIIKTEALPAPDVIKIDVEGAEKKVLHGMESTLTESECRIIYCEVHPEKSGLGNALYSEITDQFERAGFEWCVLEGTERVTLKATR
jgi:FkbM family methyltransferase